MSDISRWMKREEHGTICAHAIVELGTLDTFPLLVAPKGGATVLRVRFSPLADYAISATDYWVLSLKVYRNDGTEVLTIPLTNASLAVLPFAKHKTMTWPPQGRFDERVEETHTVHLHVDETGSPSGHLGVQLDYLMAGR